MDLLAISGHHLWGIVITVHHDVAKFGVGFVAKFLGHLGTDFDELIKDILEFVFLGVEAVIVNLRGFFSGLTVKVLEEFAHLRHVIFLSAELEGDSGSNSLIFHDELGFFLFEGDD